MDSVQMNKILCGAHIVLWDDEYEGECELEDGHEGDHWDGISWFNDDYELTDHLHGM